MWTYKFDYSPRHCWPNTNGKFLLDPSQKEDFFTVIECSNPEDHPYSRGQTEYIRWIRKLAGLTEGIVTGYEDNWLTLGPTNMADGTEAYCENYGGLVKAFLFNKEGFVIVEIEDTELSIVAEEAKLQTDLSYAEDFVNV